MKRTLKRWTYLTHRWLGIGLCLLLALWFLSGMVMMYVGYPKLTEEERLAHLPDLNPVSSVPTILSPGAALQAAGIEELQQVRSLRLNRARAGAPTYWLERTGQPVLAIDATSGQSLQLVDAAVALASAQAYAGDRSPVLAKGTLFEDANTHSRGLDSHRPLWRFDIAQGPLARLYISGATGEVIRDVSRTELYWNWVGAWVHWLYMFRGNAFNTFHSDIINWLSVISMVLVLTGAVVGIWRWRFKAPYKSGARSPYPSVWMRWHHVLGLLFAVVCMTWLFSGLMSMRPWGMLRSPPAPLQFSAMQGQLQWPYLQDLPGSDTSSFSALKELRWLPLLGESVVLQVTAQGPIYAMNVRTGQRHQPSQAQVIQAAQNLMTAPITQWDSLSAYDLYYYQRAPHTMTGGRDKPLPIYRIAFEDVAQTWVHLDASTGQLLGTLNSTERLSRWLFTMLHSWDWLPLLNRRPLWDGVMIALSLGGLAISATGVVIAWRRLRQKIV